MVGLSRYWDCKISEACVGIFDNLIAYALAPALAKSRCTLQAVKLGIRRSDRVQYLFYALFIGS